MSLFVKIIIFCFEIIPRLIVCQSVKILGRIRVQSRLSRVLVHL